MPAKHRNKDAYQYLNHNQDAAGVHPEIPPNKLGVPVEDFDKPLPS
ncbi:MAG: hypothetical protein WC876_04150 [Candidatus Thermoplasmatota archaeon]|jgi:hypothetical protein